MSDVRFRTQEIGSLAKPSWRVKTFAGRPFDDQDIEEAKRWGRRLEVDGHERLLEVLRAGQFGAAELAEIDDWAAVYGIRLLEKAGLDVVYDGEQRRTEMYDHVAAFADGFEPRGIVRSFDNKYYAKAGVVAEPVLAEPGHRSLVECSRDAGLLVVGLSDRWRQEGLGRVRSRLVEAPPAPTVLVRRGPRPGGLAPLETATRFGWSLTASTR